MNVTGYRLKHRETTLRLISELRADRALWRRLARRGKTKAIREIMRRAQPEARLQAAVCQWLMIAGEPGLIYFHVPNGMVSDPISVTRLKAQGLLPGVADLVVIPPGKRACFLELKAPSGKLSPEQKAFQEACHANGSPYAIADNIDDALRILRRWGAIDGSLKDKWGRIDSRSLKASKVKNKARARAAKLTPEERKDIASKAAKSRWQRRAADPAGQERAA